MRMTYSDGVIPMIDVDLPVGWVVTSSAKWWRAISPGRTMYIVVTKFDDDYKSTLYRYDDNVVVIDITAAGISHVVPSINRFVSLASMSEPAYVS